VAVCACVALAGCGANERSRGPARGLIPGARAVPLGTGPRFGLPSLGALARRGAPIGRLHCGTGGARFGVHIELFAAGRVLLVPAGVGMAPPRVRDGAYVRSARCSYPLRTREPTGVIEVARSARLSLGDLFDVWGQPMSRRRLAGWRAGHGRRVLAFVGGRPYAGDPRAIRLRRHAEIVLEVGPRIAPHMSYRFPPGL
jgi:hypothetical protein